MAPICVPCQRFYRPEKNGFTFLEGMPVCIENNNSTYIQPGKVDADKWQPYKLWRGDLWKCEGCGHLIISGVGQAPWSEHYLPNFKGLVERYATKYKDLPYPYQVNDCY